MKTLATRTVPVLAAAVACLAAGCSDDPTAGYTLQSQYVQGIETVAVPIFHRGREVYRRGLEMKLTEAVIKRVELDTPYKVVAKSRADTLLTGTIDRVSQRVLSYNPDTGRPREMEVALSVTVTWTDLRSGDVIARRTGLRQAATYIPPSPFGEEFFHGSTDAIDRLAVRIVQQMQAPW